MQFLEYAGNHPYLLSFAVLMLLAVIVNEVRTRHAAFAAVIPQDLIRMMNQGAAVFDLRRSEEFALGHIQGARAFDVSQILKANESLKKYKEKPLIVYCETGSIGGSAARELTRQGFTKAYNLRGGLAAWRAESLPLAKPTTSGKSAKASA
jgi:rhodanese-related sulfurtransferase